ELVVFSFTFFFFSSRRRHTRFSRDWSSDVCSSDLKRSGFLARLLDVLLPHREGFRERPAAARRQDAERVIPDHGERRRNGFTGRRTQRLSVPASETRCSVHAVADDMNHPETRENLPPDRQ